MQRCIVPAPCRFRGRIDFGAAASHDLPRADEGTLDGPGVHVRATPDCRLIVDGTRLCVAVGHPRFPDEVAHHRDDAARWLASWDRHGADAPSRVKGPYAVALVDVRARRALLATDRFAIEPLCYAFDGAILSFADRADAVFVKGPADVDAQAIYDYLYFHVIPAPRTIYRGVSRLRGGHALVVERGSAALRRHWLPKFSESDRTPIGELKQRFRSLLHDAVARDASGPGVGSFLSGGTDSSTIAGMMAQVRGSAAAPTFSIGFDVAGYDELDYARIAARHFHTPHHEYYLTPRDVVEAVPLVAARYDQPFGNSSALAAFHCAKLARETGMVTLLAGDGGDELFGGNTRYATQRLFASYEHVPSWLRTRLLEPALLDAPAVQRYLVSRKLASFVRQARVAMPERMETYNLLLRIGIAEILDPEFAAAVDVEDPPRQQRAVYAEVESRSLVNRMLAYDWKYTLADNDLPKVVETAALAGMSVRFPLLCDELVDFSLALRPALKLRGMTLRYFFKQALRGFLPDATIAKKKHGFGMPFGAWLVRDRALRDFALDSLSDLDGRRIIRRDFLRALLDSRLAEHPGYYGEMVWILLMLASWFGLQDRLPVAAEAMPAD